MNHSTSIERAADREVVVTRMIDAPVTKVFAAWTQAALFRQWWVPKSMPVTLKSCDMDVHVGGGYRLVFEHEGSEMAFFGTYREVVPDTRLVWTNDEAGDAGQVTTVTFEPVAGQTRVVMRELHPSREALDTALASGSMDCMPETFAQLDALLSAG